MRRIIILTTLLCSFLSFSQTKEIDSLSVELAFQDQDSSKVDTSLSLIKALYGIGEYDKALKYIVQSEKLASDINYIKATAKIMFYKALVFAQKNDYINAINGYSKSKTLFLQLKDTLSVAKVNNSIGLIEIKRGNYAIGLQYCLAAINILEKQGLIRELNMAYDSLADAYYEIKAYDKAIEFYLKAMEIQRKLNDKPGLIASNSKLAELYSMKKEFRKAIDYYESVLSFVNTDSIKGIIYPKLGGEYLKFNDFDKAQDYLVKAYNINYRAGDKTNLLVTLNNLGNLNLKEDRLKIAQKQLMEAGELAESLNQKEELLKNYQLMKVLDSTERNFQQAFEWQRKYFNLKVLLEKENNQVLNSEVNSIPLELNPNFDKATSGENLEASTSEKDGLLNLDEINKYKIIFYALVGALAFVLVFIVMLYMKRNNNIRYTQELEEKNIKLQLQNDAFEERTRHLESVNNVKDKLFSIVSHDLKDSLSSINGFIDLLKDGSLSREEFDNLIPELSENANNASLLLFNLLNWSKSQMQSLEPKPSLFDIQEVFEAKTKLIEQRLESKGINLIDHSLRDFAYADRSMIEIVIQNLLANALKFCKNGDTITISNHISNGSCVISIADTGVGISKENISKLFKNNSFSTMGTNNEKGTGLGLSICKELVELNHGKIWVESTLNVGTTFYVELPKSRSNGD
ncbi:tetratricopeptide repeat-containing sensor histidine kinase [Gaetbulibacter sp. M240]|uniref:tetratricopeptide repeat-containing sensor histidine kinase n=1 Tax=Gaetbulibacter sp. M240 TaxID=3126511 RepID=UPI00374E783F